MKKKNSKCMMFLLVLAALLLVAGCNSGSQPTEPPAQNGPGAEEPAEQVSANAEALVEDRCARCHNLDRVYRERDAELWPDIVTDMVKKSPGLLTDEEYGIVVEFLQKNYAK